MFSQMAGLHIFSKAWTVCQMSPSIFLRMQPFGTFYQNELNKETKTSMLLDKRLVRNYF